MSHINTNNVTVLLYGGPSLNNFTNIVTDDSTEFDDQLK